MVPILNKRAYHDYTILEEFTAGMVLSGPEAKSVKTGHMNLSGAYVTFDRGGNPVLTNADIPPYPAARHAQTGYDPRRARTLLLTTKEIDRLRGALTSKGTAIVPLRAFTHRRLVKILIGLAKGKKEYDKRETIKKREIQKKIRSRLLS